MPYYTKEQIQQARQVDLLTYLQRHNPEELVHVSGGTYCTKSHDSLKISNGKWCWWSHNIGGSTALDYLVKVCGYKLPEAVGMILGEQPQLSSRPVSKPHPKPHPGFQLPERNSNTRRVFAYLCARGIDAEIINHCIKSGQLYEDAKRHNCVFVGFEHGTAKYASLRGTLSHSTFVGEVAGSEKRYSFCMPLQANNRESVCVFESAIDALSYLSILKRKGQNWRSANCLSLSGIYRPKADAELKLPLALETYLQHNPGIQKIILCLDNDERGREAAQALQQCLHGYQVLDNPPPKGKDYNDYLQIQKGIAGRVKTRGGEER